ncbi:alpha/beta fold hydrolase [Peptoclostridium acidaminophilum]|uniref:alpha/beta fold hydrolase n=1 Tax=Peptoclostridium acidaminophilum TaxID=1731 RepID=UPI00046D2540|nr:alpha/beta hydrolase [Peptoclostridium acidaminophilum]
MAQNVKCVELANQVMIPYLENGNVEGIPLILLHGLADSLHVFELLLPYIPESIRTITLTQRGHGDASCPQSGYGTEDFSSDLLLFMEALKIEKAVVLGASSGGFAARSFAVENPELTLGLILLGSPSALKDNPFAIEMWESTISKLKDPVDAEFVRGFASSITSQKVPRAFMEMMVKENLKVPASVWKETYKGILAEDFPGKLHKIKAPTLIIWGEEDSILPKSDQEALSKAITNSKLVVCPSAGHMLYLEKPDVVAAKIINFLQNEINYR